jgi:hypothetical protein
MNGAILAYLLGFACVWAVVALGCAALGGLRNITRDWDRAFQRELESDRLIVAESRARVWDIRQRG